MRFLRRLLALALVTGCSTIQSESRKAQRALAHAGDRIEEGADAAGRKTRSLWNRIFGGGDDERPARTAADNEPSSSEAAPAKFDTYAEEHVGD